MLFPEGIILLQVLYLLRRDLLARLLLVQEALNSIFFRFIQRSGLGQPSGSQCLGCPYIHCTCFILLPVYNSVNQIHTCLAPNRNLAISTFIYIVSFNRRNYYVR